MSKNSQVSRVAIYFVSAAILLVAACPAIVRAQSTNASLSGVVKDTSGGVIPGVELVLTAQLTNTEQHFTGKDGLYRFANLHAGNYILSASAKGFERFVQQEIVLALNEVATVDVTLSVGAASQRVAAMVTAF